MEWGKIHTYMTEHPMSPKPAAPIDIEPEPLYLPCEEPMMSEPPPEEEEEEEARVIVIEMCGRRTG